MKSGNSEFSKWYIGDLLSPEDREELIQDANRDAKAMKLTNRPQYVVGKCQETRLETLPYHNRS